MALESGEQHVPQLTPCLVQELLRRHPEEPPLPHHLHLQGHPLDHPWITSLVSWNTLTCAVPVTEMGTPSLVRTAVQRGSK